VVKVLALKRIPFLMALLLVPAASAKADPVVFTFDDLTPGNAVVRLQPGNVVVLSFISASGAGGSASSVVRVVQTSSATSPPNALFSSGHTDSVGTYDSLLIFFSGPQSSGPGCQPCTDFLSLNVMGTTAGQTEPWRVVFYNSQREALFTVTGVTDQLVSFFSASRDIRSASLFTTNGGREGIDNLTYNSPIPEPATVLTLGTGLLGAAAMRRRHKRRRA
jgi:hypothetical protein